MWFVLSSLVLVHILGGDVIVSIHLQEYYLVGEEGRV